MTLTEKLGYFYKLPFESKLWFGFTLFGSFILWVWLYLLKISNVNFLMGSHMQNRLLCVLAEEEQIKKAWRIGRVVDAVSKGVPWKSECLTEALCVRLLMKIYNIPSVLYLGAKIDKDNNDKLVAHAWVTLGQYTIIGGEESSQNYIVSATFTYPRISA